jgi:hypothetical protein
MTLQLTLPPELEKRLRREAERLGISGDDVTLRLLDEHLPPDERKAAALAMLEGWMKEDERMSEEERKSNEAVLRSIDEDRPAYRKLFGDLIEDESAGKVGTEHAFA